MAFRYNVEFKYIMLSAAWGKPPNDITKLVPVLFFEPLTHSDMADVMEVSDDLPSKTKLVSAGFVTINDKGEVSCHGSSESLRMRGKPHQSKDEDANTIRHYNYMHGVQS